MCPRMFVPDIAIEERGPLSISAAAPALPRLNRGEARKTAFVNSTNRAVRVRLLTPSEIAPTPSEAQTPPRSPPRRGLSLRFTVSRPRNPLEFAARANLMLLCAASATS
jgi:hypothetical protein